MTQTIKNRPGQNVTQHHIKALEVLNIEIEALQHLSHIINGEFNRIVELILATLKHHGKIIITGVGKNKFIGEKICATLNSTGCPAVFLHPTEALHGDIGIVKQNDIALVLSYSGTSEEVLMLLPILKRIGVPMIALTGNPESPLAQASDGVLCCTVLREACPFNMAPTASTTAALALGDALAMALVEARHFTIEDYARIHPAGAIGRSLILKVSDIMRTGARLTTVLEHTHLHEAILSMTTAKSGAVVIVDESSHLLGIFTDGDLRRCLTKGLDCMTAEIHSVMTRTPKFVRANQMAVELVPIFKNYQIDDLVVVDEDMHVVGLVDIQDLPRLKVL